MTNKLTTKEFDYAGLVTNDEAGKLRYYKSELGNKKKAISEAVLETGRILCEVRELLSNHNKGVFQVWLLSCNYSKSSAYNYMDAHEAFGSCPTVGQLEPTAMYTLAKNEEARNVALKLAGKGEVVTGKRAKEIVKDCNPVEKKEVDTSPADVADSPAGNKEELEQCPNCSGTEWNEDFDGTICSNCCHPLGEPIGDPEPEEESVDESWRLERSRAVKTVEALMRSVDDLHDLRSNAPAHGRLIGFSKQAFSILKEWDA